MAISFVVVFAFMAMLFWGFGDFFIQKSVKKIGSLESLAWIGLIGSVGLFPLVIKDLHLLQNFTNLILIVGLGIISFISVIFGFRALKEGKLSVVDVIIEAELPITIALGFIFLKESLTMTQMIIILFILLGIVLTAIKSFSHFKSRIEKGVILAFIAAIFFGGTNIMVGVSSKLISPIMAIWGSWVFFTLISIIFIISKKGFKKFLVHGSGNKKLIIATGIIDTLAWVFYALAVSKSEISLITAITESYPALALFLGVFFNNEKIMFHQYAGAFIAIVCSVLLSLTII